MRIFLRMLVTVITLLLNTAVSAVELQAGQVYDGGSEISVASLGIRFTIPENWKGALMEGGEGFLMESSSGSATIVAIADSISENEAYTRLQGPLTLSNAIQLVLDGKVKREGNKMSASYHVTYNPQLKAQVKALSAANGTSIAFFLVTSATELAGYKQQLEQVFSSLVIDAPKITTPLISQTKINSEDSDRSWSGYLKGKHIVRYFTSSGYTEEQHIWLCSNGQYVRRFNSGGFGGGASGAFQGNYDGQWSAEGEGEQGRLVLVTADNQASSYQLRWDYEKNQLFVDGKRWLHDRNNICQ